jgi:hypothetical protein
MLRVKAAPSLERKSIAIASAAAFLLAVAAAAFSAAAQEPPDSPPVVHLPGSSPPSSGAANSTVRAEDPVAHEDAAKLAELTGVRNKLQQNFSASMHNALDEMRRQYPQIDPRFVAEWEKRMRARFNPDDYMAVVIRVYEEHYTAAELEEMIRAVRAKQSSRPVTPSPQLAAKIRANAIDVQSEIMGGFSEIGARKGGEIGREIGEEHPDWVKNLIPAAPAAAK